MGWGRMDEHEELNELSGRVLHVIYANEENGYGVYILSFQCCFTEFCKYCS